VAKATPATTRIKATLAVSNAAPRRASTDRIFIAPPDSIGFRSGQTEAWPEGWHREPFPEQRR
jgi:hypothetical protein